MSTRSSAPPLSFRLARAAQEVGRWAAAEQGYRETLELFPEALPAYANLVTVLDAQGRWRDAEQVLRAALERWPEHPRLRINLGLSRLAAGDYEEGFPLYEDRRYAERDPVNVPDLSFPEWDGRRTRSLLLFPEQGLGDQIQFARYVPVLREQGVEVTLTCHPSLQRLFEPMGVPTVATQGTVTFERHDGWALLGSLPLRLGTRVDTIPPPIPVVAKACRTGGIGVVVRGNAMHHNDRNRSLSPEAAAALLGLPGALSLLPEDTGAQDFQATADIIAGLDLVVSVDTSVAHLAASMGKPTWILIPCVKCDWRWMREREDSPWYPSARLFRQSSPGDWSGAVRRILEALDSA